MKIKIQKVNQTNPVTHVMGFAARVVSNGKAEFETLCEEASKNTTAHKSEIRLCFELGLEEAARQLKQGKIVDLGPLGKLYPAVSSGWFSSSDLLTMDSVKCHVNYQPSEDIKAAIMGASLSWSKVASDDEEDTPEDGGDTEEPGGDISVTVNIPSAMQSMGDVQINDRTKGKTDSILASEGDTVTIKAIPVSGDYQFNSWSDGNTSSTRTITIVAGSEMAFTASFSPVE